MKKVCYIFYWFLAIIIASVLLFFLKPQETINNIIQAIALITLVFVTISYADHTKKLVDREKVSFEEEKKRRSADFGEKKLREFYVPLKGKIYLMEVLLREVTADLEFIKYETFEIVDLITKHGAIVTKKLDNAIYKLVKILHKIKILKEEGEVLEEWKREVLIRMEEVEKLNDKEIDRIEDKINEVYGLITEEFRKELE